MAKKIMYITCGRVKYRKGKIHCVAATYWGNTATPLDSCGLPGEYSTEVPQPARTWTDWSARCRTVTCSDVLRWMGCLLMAQRSGVRVSVAPLRDISAGQTHIRSRDTGQVPLFQHWTEPRSTMRADRCFRSSETISRSGRSSCAVARGLRTDGVFSQVSGVIF